MSTRDGVDNVGTPVYATQTVPCNNPIAAIGEYIFFENLPRNMFHDFQLVSTNGVFLYIVRVEWLQESDGELRAEVYVDDLGMGGTGTCNIRRISFTEGISVASAKKELKQVKVTYAKRRARR
jgi:hypothetical protein